MGDSEDWEIREIGRSGRFGRLKGIGRFGRFGRLGGSGDWGKSLYVAESENLLEPRRIREIGKFGRFGDSGDLEKSPESSNLPIPPGFLEVLNFRNI